MKWTKSYISVVSHLIKMKFGVAKHVGWYLIGTKSHQDPPRIGQDIVLYFYTPSVIKKIFLWDKKEEGCGKSTPECVCSDFIPRPPPLATPYLSLVVVLFLTQD